MPSPTPSAPYTLRVMVEMIVGGVPKRVHVWRGVDGKEVVSFSRVMTEDDVAAIVSGGLALAGSVNVSALFKGLHGGRPRRRRRLITGGGL